MKILVLNGPNLNMLGIRKPEIYGIDTLDAINTYLKKKFPDLDLEFYQSNIEGEIINRLHFAHKSYQGVVINPGAWSHYSIALRDAVESCILPVIEVHLSNIAAREDFRHISVISPVAEGTISGFGRYSYVLALQAMANRLSKKEK
jgi:3-dehydroquinate dehydratase-2